MYMSARREREGHFAMAIVVNLIAFQAHIFIDTHI